MSKALGFRQAGDTPLPVVSRPVSTGGCDVARLVSAASTNATVAKSSPGVLYGWSLYNINAAARYVKVYNTATQPDVGTDTPKLTLLIPGGSTQGAGNNFEFGPGIEFDTGISFGITTGAADNNTGAVASGEIVTNLMFK